MLRLQIIAPTDVNGNGMFIGINNSCHRPTLRIGPLQIKTEGTTHFIPNVCKITFGLEKTFEINKGSAINLAKSPISRVYGLLALINLAKEKEFNHLLDSLIDAKLCSGQTKYAMEFIPMVHMIMYHV